MRQHVLKLRKFLKSREAGMGKATFHKKYFKALHASFIRDESGLTLIDVAIALMLIGLIVAPIVQQYHNWEKRAEVGTTSGNLRIADEAIQQFYFDNNRYPCPADPTLNATDANYGREDCTGANPNIVIAASRDVDNFDGDNDPLTGVDNAWVGTLPFQDLKMTPREALDAWGYKINYTVTDLLASPTLNDPAGVFNAGFGLITINRDRRSISPGGGADPVCTDVFETTNNIHYLLHSSGKTGVGAYSAEGVIVQACPAAGATLEEENCNNDAIFRFDECLYNDVAGVNFYDDQFYGDSLSKTNVPSKMWDNATNPDNVGSVVGYIGLGNDDPQSALDVIGNIRAERDPTDPTKLGQAHASEYCDPDGQNCFTSNVIAGDDPNMTCAGGEGMSGIGSSRAKCSQAIPSVTATSCPDGQYISGISAAGVVTCLAP